MGRPRTSSGCPKDGLDDPNCAPRSPRNALGQLQRRSWNTPARHPSALAAQRAVRTARRTIFSRFLFVARLLRCVFRTIFFDVLLTSQEVARARTRETKNLEKTSVSASKIEVLGRPRRVWTAWSHAKSAQSSGKTHPERAGASIFLEKLARRGLSSAKRRAARRFQGARARGTRQPVKEPR